MEDFHKTRRLPPYVFEQVNRLKASEPPPAPPATPEDVVLLRDIRDALTKR